jgi:hypothetical protein
MDFYVIKFCDVYTHNKAVHQITEMPQIYRNTPKILPKYPITYWNTPQNIFRYILESSTPTPNFIEIGYDLKTLWPKNQFLGETYNVNLSFFPLQY